MQAIKISAPGGYTTVQDFGRYGYQNMGVPVSGMLDQSAGSMANLLVGNAETAAVLEITVMGPSFEVLNDMDLALTGARMEILVNDKPVSMWQSFRVKRGDSVSIGQVESGCRSYLAAAGGFDIPKVMGSCSTYAGGKLGGFEGRPLKKDDILLVHKTSLMSRHLHIPEHLIPSYLSKVNIRAVPGPQDDYFDEGLATLFSSEYMVTAKADRMGYRLTGNSIPIRGDMPKSIISEPSVPGSIQIPADEQPIILLLEQTVGGYAKIATVISADIPVIAQTTPGDFIAFEKIDIKTAQTIYADSKKKIETVKKMMGSQH